MSTRKVPECQQIEKQDVLHMLDEVGVVYHENIFVVEAKKYLKQWIANNVKPEIVTAAAEQGHRVLFTPPYYSDLQPIEYLWACVKGHIGRSYTTGTTLAQVEEKLLCEFHSLLSTQGCRLVESLIEAVDKTICKFKSEIAEEIDDNSDRNAASTRSESIHGDTSESDSEI